jgi:vacuolar-type H+-ATPase subunit E/Vma4
MTSDRGIEEDLEDTVEGLKRAAKKAKHRFEEEELKAKHRIEEAAEEAKDKAD